MTQFFKALWRGINISRKIFLNLIFLLFLFWLITLLVSSSGSKPQIEKGIALVLQPEGQIVDQLTYVDPLEKIMQDSLAPQQPTETLLYDLIDALENAKDDKRITALVISPQYLTGAGLTKLEELAAAINDFKSSGKKVFAFADNYNQTQYHLAANADKIYLNPQGGVFINGFATVGTYFKSFLDRLGINMHVFKVGTFKSAVEPFIRDDMSAEAKLANKAWMDDLWGNFLADLAANRAITADDISNYIDNYKELINQYRGNISQLALDQKLVDQLATRIEFNQQLGELVGFYENHSFKSIKHTEYLQGIRGAIPYVDAYKPRIAVITARGNILDGEHKEGTIGGDTVSRIIRKARTNDKVKAIVLRINSGGGSAFASELIREELVKAQQQGIKVVASMGDVAASGGYWIAASSDEIWASASTITGSIGIFGLLPTFEKPLNDYGIYRDGVGTTKYASAYDLGRPLSEDVKDIIQTSIEAGYESFLELVAEGRNMQRDEVDKIAQGRVWSGEQAHKLGLVDHLGSLEQAIQSAAKLAKLDADSYEVWHVKRQLSRRELLVQQLLNNASLSKFRDSAISKPDKITNGLYQQFLAISTELDKWNDPKHVYAKCFCEIK